MPLKPMFGMRISLLYGNIFSSLKLRHSFTHNISKNRHKTYDVRTYARPSPDIKTCALMPCLIASCILILAVKFLCEVYR